jgi:hypothetical protein
MWYFNPARHDDPTDSTSPTSPALVALAPPQIEPGIDEPGFIEVQYDEVAGIITMPDESTIQWKTEPIPQPDIAQFQLECIESYEILMEYAFINLPGKAASLANIIARLTPEGLPIMVTKWNEIFLDCGLDSNIPNLINIAASNNHIPLTMNTDFTLSIVM